MDKLEINPTLFITCRLCLGDLGVYQIVPAVKEQILYCFDINVEPFDGLPQVICKKCEATLSNFSALKKKFIDKQNDLKNKIQLRLQNGQLSKTPAASCSGTIEYESNENNIKTTRKRLTCISTSSSDYEETSKTNLNEKNSHGYEENSSENEIQRQGSWAASYKRQYVCRICNLRTPHVKSLKAHIKSNHSVLKKKFRNIFKRHCEVTLHKIEDKQNITGCRSKVMHSREKIIKNVNPEYYIMYTIKNSRHDDARYVNKIRNSRKRLKSNNHKSSDSSDEAIKVSRKRISRRLSSRSSNDTVVLDAVNKSNLSEHDKDLKISQIEHTPMESGDCINIDDSSEESEKENTKKSKTDITNQTSDINKDLKVNEEDVHNIISTSETKYIRKHNHDNLITKSKKHPSDIAKLLKRKILSIGRKIINKKKSVNCTPLLRFIEHKNADVMWFPRSIMYNDSQESDYVRIMARSKNVGENDNYESGWTDMPRASNQSSGQLFDIAWKCSKKSVVVKGHFGEATSKLDTNPKVDSAVLIADPNCCVNDTKILLNANPVANPKQLPKKSVTTEIKSGKLLAINSSNSEQICMPIITNTTSLAPPILIQDNKNTPINGLETKKDDLNSVGPKIKVKPASELLSDETLSRMKESNQMEKMFSPGQQIPLQNENNQSNILMPERPTISQIHNTTQSQNENIELIADNTWNNDFMVLDTIELPNMRTNSPFQYLKQLLQLHNLVLLDTDVILSKDFHCLIKFKVLFRQETINVNLCLGLYCSKNVFCLKIIDRNEENILNFSKISANWQWEILKIYTGEVVNKVLDNAKKIGQDVYEFTSSFLCLLKSIKLL